MPEYGYPGASDEKGVDRLVVGGSIHDKTENLGAEIAAASAAYVKAEADAVITRLNAVIAVLKENGIVI